MLMSIPLEPKIHDKISCSTPALLISPCDPQETEADSNNARTSEIVTYIVTVTLP